MGRQEMVIGVIGNGFNEAGEPDDASVHCLNQAMSLARGCELATVVLSGIQAGKDGQILAQKLLAMGMEKRNQERPWRMDADSIHFHATNHPENPEWHLPEPAGSLAQVFDYRVRLGLMSSTVVLVAPFSKIELLKNCMKANAGMDYDHTVFVSVG